MKKDADRYIERRTLFFGQLPPRLDGLKVIFLSDIHYSLHRKTIYDRIHETIRLEKPEILILGGDLVDHRMSWCEVLNWLTLLPDVPHKIAVPGNWEYYQDETSERFSQRMRGAGFTALCDESIKIVLKDDVSITLTGIDDYQSGIPSVKRAFAGVNDQEFCLAVTHSPDVMQDLRGTEPFNLMLCGHTHGGQFRIPGFGAVFTNTAVGKQFEGGLYQLDRERKVYVSRGLGEGLVKLRFFCPPEITVLSLKHRWAQPT